MFCICVVRIQRIEHIAEALKVVRGLSVAAEDVDDREATVGVKVCRGPIDEYRLLRNSTAVGGAQCRRSNRGLHDVAARIGIGDLEVPRAIEPVRKAGIHVADHRQQPLPDDYRPANVAVQQFVF
jgi:hypothetical protein